jgi:hypothetical protein
MEGIEGKDTATFDTATSQDSISTSFGHKRGSNRDILLEKKRGCQLNYVLWQIQYTSSHDHLSYGIFLSTLDRPRWHILAILV